ncbi:NmrA/HSCARG family protein [Amycolatopsis endophytica]
MTRALTAAGVPVRALVRDPGSDRARALAANDVELVRGDLLDPATVSAALGGDVRGVFSVQTPDMRDPSGDAELVQGRNLIEAARAAGIRQFVHTSVGGADQHRDAPGWAEGRWKILEHYYETKSALQHLVRTAGFERWTLLKPGFFMENFLPPSFLLPQGLDGGLITVIRPDTELAMVAVADIGAAGAAAFLAPEAFHQVELELAGERVTVARAAKVLSESLGVELTAPEMSFDEAVAAGMPEFAGMHEWHNTVSQPARPETARALGIPVTSFRAWVDAHRDQLRAASSGV